MHIRRNSSLSVFNSVFAGYNTGLLLDGTKSYTNATSATAKTLDIQNCALIGMKVADLAGEAKITTANVAGTGTSTEITAFFNTTAYANSLIAENATAKIASSFYDGATSTKPSSFLPEAGSALLTGASFASTKISGTGTFFTPTTHIGAFGVTDWTKEAWVNFDPQNTVY